MKIVDKNGRLVKFKLNPQQTELLNGLEKYNVCLKSRQLGISAFSTAYSLYIAQTRPNSTCLLVSYSLESATGIFEKLKQLYNDMVEPIKVPLIANNKKELKFTNGSRIIVCTIGTKPVARGLSIAYCHISEVGFCKDNIPQQLLAIEQAMLPSSCVLLESTANGLNYFSELWNKAVRGDNMYKPFFFNWIDDKIMFKEEYKQFCEIYVNKHGGLPSESDLDDDEKIYVELGASIEQIVWRRMKIGNSDIASFKQEFPSNPTEAFLSTGNNIFDPNHINDRSLYIHEVVVIGKPDNLPISLSNWFNRGLSIWDIPTSNSKYYIGVDCSEGVGQDYSAFSVFSREGIQMCEFKSNTIKPYEFAEMVRDIGVYYNNGLIVIEKASSGHTVLEKLRNDYKYPNVYKQIEYDNRGKAIPKIGFTMTSKHKPIIINEFVELFETNQIVINSKDLLNEMKLFAWENGSMNAIRGQHDDLVISTALALHGMRSNTNYL